MKVLFFCNLVPEKMGAYEWFLVQMGRRFRDAGDVFLLVLAGEPIPMVAERLREAGISWRILPGWTDAQGQEHAWAYVKPALRLVREEKPDVAVLNYGNELPGLTVALATHVLGPWRTRWVWQQHQQVRDPSPVSRHFSALRSLTLGFRHFVAVYDGGRRSMLLRGISDNHVSVIYNGITDHKPARAPGWLREELNIPKDLPLLLNTGWLVGRKRVDFLLRALAKVPNAGSLAKPQRKGPRGRGSSPDQQEFAGLAMGGTAASPTVSGSSAEMNARGNSRGFHLVIAGDGPERANLERLCRELNLQESVTFLGMRSDVREIVAECDLLVHTAQAETCTYAITEAMAAGITAVVTDAGAAREQIETGVSGHVVGSDDLDGFARHIGRLLDDAPHRRQMGLAARRRFEARYRLETAVEQYHTLCRRLAGG